jgi:hypothetical protein
MYDLAIVGGGISGGLTLIYLLEELQARRQPHQVPVGLRALSGWHGLIAPAILGEARLTATLRMPSSC